MGQGSAGSKQIPYNPEWDKSGNNGDHFGWRKREFIEQYIAPLVHGNR
jgi:hypothetical protein